METLRAKRELRKKTESLGGAEGW